VPDVAALNVVISADTKDLEAGLARAEQSVSKAGSAIQSAMGGALIAGVAGLGAALAGSVKSAADFEKGISAISAVSGATKSELEGIRQTALQLGKDTSFSASEAAAGMEEMVKAGVSLQDVMNGAGRAALDLAAAGGLAVPEAAALMSNAINIFKKDNLSAAQSADIISQAANASAISVHDFGFSLSSVGAVANTIGLTLQDTATAIAVLGQNGLKGSDAGTSLKTMLLNLAAPTEKAVTMMHQLGIVTADGANQFFDAQGKVKGMAEVAGILQNSLKGLTKAQQIAALETIFGTDAVRAAAIMADVGTEGINKMAEAEKNAGTARSVAAERLNNLSGAWEAFMGSVETGAIILGSLFLPALKETVTGLTSFVNQSITAIEMLPDAWKDVVVAFTGGQMDDYFDTLLTDVLGFSGETAQAFEDIIRAAGEMWAGIQPILAGIATAIQDNIAPIAAFVAGFLGAIGTAGLFAAAIAAVTAVLGLLLSPLGLVAIAVGALAVAWQTNFLQIRDIVALVLNGEIKAAFDLFITNLSAMTTLIAAQLLLWAQQFIAWIAPFIPPMLAALAAMAVQFYAWISAQIPPIIAQLLLWGQEFIAWIAPQIPPMLAELQKLGLALADWIIAQLPGIVAKLTEWGLLFGTWVALVAIPELVKALPGIAAAIFDWALQTSAAMIVRLAALGKAIVDGIYKGFTEAWATIGPRIMEAIASVFKMPSLSFGGGGGSTQALSFGSSVSGGGSAHVAPYLGLINQVSAETGVPADVLAALMEVEGSGAGSTSPAGAKGLMQTMPNWTRPGEDPYDPLTSIRLGARAVTEKYNATGSWQQAGRAYFGYGVDAGGMDTNTYGARYDAARSRYQQTGNVPGRMDRIPLGGGGVGGGAPGSDPSQWPGFMSQVNEQLPDYLMSLDTIQQAGTLAFNGTTQAAVVAGAGLISASTDALGNVTRIYSDATGVIGATITNAGGQIVNSWGTTGNAVVAQSETTTAAVVAQTNLMATGALTSVTNLGTGFLTTVQTTAGTAIATVTDMTGQITSQYATLANGVTLNAGTMQTGVLTATTAMHDGTILSVQDMAGNAIVTVTDMHGQVTNQYTTMAAESGAVLSEFAALSLEQFGAVAESALKPIEPIENLGESLANIPQADMSDTVKQFGEAAAAAKKAQAAIKALADATEDLPGSFGGSKGGKSSGLSKKAAGGWASGLTLVGEEGPELLSLNRPHYVTPNSALSGGGGPVTVVNVSVGGSLVAQSELEDTIARAVATSLRGGSLAWSN
jgi:TP901 family phage tail tape measure protein